MLTVTGTGRFVEDPKLKETNSGTKVCEFTLAHNERRKDKNFASFFPCVIWDKAAEVITKYAKKGDVIEIKATPRQDRWENEEGEKRSKIYYRIDQFEFISTRRKDENETAEAEPVATAGGTPDDDIPF